ncbi:40S ribosomal protein S27 [Pleurotus pulmonarius]|nr:40S ribosomal protein S27 [Pleurotus pulmonarius]KAF4606970.1 40S ribosomal protein S27 [Pleurotus pulmonarius]
MDVKCSGVQRFPPSTVRYTANIGAGCFAITTVFSHAQTVVLCGSCSSVLCQPTGGKARLTEGARYLPHTLYRPRIYSHISPPRLLIQKEELSAPPHYQNHPSYLEYTLLFTLCCIHRPVQYTFILPISSPAYALST